MTTPIDTTTISPCITTQTTNVPHKANFTWLYHETDIYYVMEDYCQPVAESFNCSTDLCQFNCECLVMKQKVLSKGNLLQTTSPTVFTSVPATSKKNKYSLHDIRLLRCFNPTCKKPKSNMAKVFHHICFMHMLKTNNEAEKWIW